MKVGRCASAALNKKNKTGWLIDNGNLLPMVGINQDVEPCLKNYHLIGKGRFNG